ncbi:DUF1642 domain-containing protein [Streptococcus pluranimalium]
MTKFKKGQEVWVKAIVVNNEPDFQGYTHLKSKNDWQFRVKLEDIVTEIPKKPIVPQFVADYIKYAKTTFCSLKGAISFDDIYIYNYANWSRDKVKLISWMSDEENQEIFAKAWLFGYEVEQEKLYTVEIPNPNCDGLTTLERVNDDYLVLTQMANFYDKWYEFPEYRLTEAEIKQDFEWAWKWAKPVEVD